MLVAKERNTYVDIMRGLAMLLVVLGHTMTGSTIEAEKSFLFNIIWALQMPMFILISGYVTRYGKVVSTGKELIKFVKKRTISYLIPWIVWTVLIRGLVFQTHNFLNPGYILWHMDTGYWFLFTIWTIAMIFGVSEFVASKICKKENIIKNTFVLGVIYIIGMVALLIIGLLFGLSFLCIKLTLYYMPFYFVGFLFGRFQDRILALKNGKATIEVVVAASFVIWIAMLVRFNLYEMSDTGIGIFIRAFTSLIGCIAVIGLGKNVDNLLSKSGDNSSQVHGSILKNSLNWVGRYSLEIYLVHGLLLNILEFESKPSFAYTQGIAIVFANYFITIILCVLVINMISSNKILNKALFGKNTYNNM